MTSPSGLQLPREELSRAYRSMCDIRNFEDSVHDEFAAGSIPGFVHLYAGEEASAVGFMMHLNDTDRIASTHRGHGHALAKGMNARVLMAELYGKRDGCCGGRGGTMHLYDRSVGPFGTNGLGGAGIPIALPGARRQPSRWALEPSDWRSQPHRNAF